MLLGCGTGAVDWCPAFMTPRSNPEHRSDHHRPRRDAGQLSRVAERATGGHALPSQKTAGAARRQPKVAAYSGRGCSTWLPIGLGLAEGMTQPDRAGRPARPAARPLVSEGAEGTLGVPSFPRRGRSDSARPRPGLSSTAVSGRAAQVGDAAGGPPGSRWACAGGYGPARAGRTDRGRPGRGWRRAAGVDDLVGDEAGWAGDQAAADDVGGRDDGVRDLVAPLAGRSGDRLEGFGYASVLLNPG